jgi:hypothetical protein
MAWSAPPRLISVTPAGVTRGKTNTLIVRGTGFTPPLEVLTSLEATVGKVVVSNNGQQATVEITVPYDVSTGFHTFRLTNPAGISNVRLLPCDTLEQLPFADEVSTLPVALSGELSGSLRRRTRFPGKQGEVVVIDVEAQRLGGSLRPVLRLLNDRNQQLAFAAGQPWWGGDARIVATLPADGSYTVELHDRLFKGPNPGHFRLKLGALTLADRAHPAAWQQGGGGPAALLGGTWLATNTFPFVAGERLPGFHPLRWPAALPITSPYPAVWISEHAEHVETRTAGEVMELPAAPLGVSGVLSAAKERDTYALAVVPGQKLRCELHARRLGSPLDGVLTLRNPAGQTLASSDDLPNSADAAIETFTVPSGVQRLLCDVHDLLGRGGPEFNYRLVVTPAEQPDFSLSLEEDRLAIPAGGTQVVRVSLTRSHFAGPVALEMPGLPEHVQLSGHPFATGAGQGLIALTAASNAVPGSHGFTELIGRGEGKIRRALAPEQPGTTLLPYLRHELAWVVTKPDPVQLAWSPASDVLFPGDVLAGNVQITRAAGSAGKVRISLLSSQTPVKKKIKENNQDKEIDDPDRNLRLAKEVVFEPDQTTAELPLFVPADLPLQSWDMALAAELLTPDGKGVVAKSYTQLRPFRTVAPLQLELTSAAAAQGVVGTGEAGVFTGKVIRAAGFERKVTVTLSGLPKGYTAPSVELPPEQSEFRLALAFPADTKAAELKDVELLATTDAMSATAARSNAVKVQVSLRAAAAAASPPAPAP